MTKEVSIKPSVGYGISLSGWYPQKEKKPIIADGQIIVPRHVFADVRLTQNDITKTYFSVDNRQNKPRVNTANGTQIHEFDDLQKNQTVNIFDSAVEVTYSPKKGQKK